MEICMSNHSRLWNPQRTLKSPPKDKHPHPTPACAWGWGAVAAAPQINEGVYSGGSLTLSAFAQKEMNGPSI